jgi:regulation of enolase protein 1 (concanavalin A-like superfamily)
MMNFHDLVEMAPDADLLREMIVYAAERLADWSLTSLQTRLIKIGARVVRHARAITFQLAEVAVSGNLFTRIIAAIHRLRTPPVPA